MKHTIEDLQAILTNANYGKAHFGPSINGYGLIADLAQQLIDVHKRLKEVLPEFLGQRGDELCDRFIEDTDLTEYWDNYINGFFETKK